MGSPLGRDVMRLTDLRDKKVKSLDGETLGRVHDVHCEKGRVVALMCGAASLIERWTAKRKGRRIPWECVVKVDSSHIVISPERPKRKTRSGASRSRQGTRRPSAPRSKR
jgi:sporulation protein YlmC with PRC-barrel domain